MQYTHRYDKTQEINAIYTSLKVTDFVKVMNSPASLPIRLSLYSIALNSSSKTKRKNKVQL